MSAEKDSFARFLKHFSKGTVLFAEGDEGEETPEDEENSADDSAAGETAPQSAN